MNPTIQFSEQQREALKQGEAVHITEAETQMDCIVVRADVFERVRSMLIDDRPLSKDEKLAAIHAVGLRANWDDPELDVYEDYRTKP